MTKIIKINQNLQNRTNLVGPWTTNDIVLSPKLAEEDITSLNYTWPKIAKCHKKLPNLNTTTKYDLDHHESTKFFGPVL